MEREREEREGGVRGRETEREGEGEGEGGRAKDGHLTGPCRPGHTLLNHGDVKVAYSACPVCLQTGTLR